MKNKIVKLIKSDLYRYYGKDDAKSFFKAVFKIPAFKYTMLFRLTNYSYKRKYKIRGLVLKLILKHYREKYGYEIPYSTTIKEGFSIVHMGGVAVNPKVKIGRNVTIGKGVTIGETYRGNKKGVPILGDRIWIGSNSTIVGNLKIGNNVLIAPNAYINFDVPENSIVIGNPAIIKRNRLATDGYLNNIVKEERV